MGERGTQSDLRRAWTARIAMATVVALVAVGLGLPGQPACPAHADVPVNQPTDCEPTAPTSSVAKASRSPRRPHRSHRRCRWAATPTASFVDLVTAWGPLEQEAKAVTAELDHVPNDARSSVTSR